MEGLLRQEAYRLYGERIKEDCLLCAKGLVDGGIITDDEIEEVDRKGRLPTPLSDQPTKKPKSKCPY